MSGEAYSKRYTGGFLDEPATSTPCDSQYLNAVERALLYLLGADPTDKDVQVWDASLVRFKTALLKNENIDPAAAISKSKLAALGIVNADVDPGAAIDSSKIAGNFPISKLNNYPADAHKVLRGDGTWPYPTGYEFGYDQITANVTVSSTSSASPTSIIAGSSYTFDGGAVFAEFFSPLLATPATAGGALDIGIWEGATFIAQLLQVNNDDVSFPQQEPGFAKLRLTPTAGAHTYSIKAWASATTGAPGVVAGLGTGGAYAPAFLRLTKV